MQFLAIEEKKETSNGIKGEGEGEEGEGEEEGEEEEEEEEDEEDGKVSDVLDIALV
jgi:hypothetical protein